MDEVRQSPIAVLIDGESLAAGVWPQIRAVCEALGKANIVRVFGDFSNNSHAAWLDVCREEGIEPVIYCPTVHGKNGADMVMTITAMDLLHNGYQGSIVLASNDQDFFPLARRLRASDMNVHGIALRAADAAKVSAYSSWNKIEYKKRTAKMASAAPIAEVPKTAVSALELANALHKILAQGAVMSLSMVGQMLVEGWPELHKTIGRNKLKARILRDVPAVKIEGHQVRRP
jgi:hypothetical protein